MANLKNVLGKLDPHHPNVTIWGGGYAGLVCALLLKRKGFHVTLNEKSNRLGGKLGSDNNPQGLSERAANAFYADQEIFNFLTSLNISPIPARKKLKRLIFFKGKTMRVSPLTFLPLLFKSFIKKPPLITSNLSVADFFSPLLGEDRIKSFLSPALRGIYAVNSQQLNMLSIWPEQEGKQYSSFFYFFKSIKKMKAHSYSFRNGMQEFIDAAKNEIGENNIHLNCSKEFTLTTNTIVATDAHSAAELLQERYPLIAKNLAMIDYCPLKSTTLFFSHTQTRFQKTFGLLVGQDEPFHTLGILLNNEIFPHRHKDGGMSCTIISQPDLNEDILKKELSELGVTSRQWQGYKEYSYTKALPIYNQSRYELIKQCHSQMPHQGLMIVGNYVAGISLREIYYTIKTAVEDLA